LIAAIAARSLTNTRAGAVCTGVVPDESFTLQAGDRVTIGISGIGTLSNSVQVV
jgi:2-keto-4-pentenoate hydratase/2-oxohepta-3-ene-1,7-dioic acid hydratase in catechol pathway